MYMPLISMLIVIALFKRSLMIFESPSFHLNPPLSFKSLTYHSQVRTVSDMQRASNDKIRALNINKGPQISLTPAKTT